MFDFVTQSDQKPEIVCGISIDRRAVIVEAAFQLPILVGPMLCSIEPTPFWSLTEISIVDPF